MKYLYDYERLLNDYEIDSKPLNSRNFLEIACPFCGESGFHGGIHVEKNYYKCWKCSFQPIEEVIKLLTGENWRDIQLNYKINPDARDLYLLKNQEKPAPAVSISLPIGTVEINQRQRDYLEGRGFDPDYLIEKYKIKGTGHLGEYNFRIIIPIYFEHKLVSYQGRDYTGKAYRRYMACPKDEEIIHHKHILYGYDDVSGNHVIVVEGIFDKWRLGNHAVATFGTAYTNAQVNLLTKFKKISILFDSEEEAQNHAEDLAGELAGLGVETKTLMLEEGDPAELSQKEADNLVKEILKGE